MINQLKTLLHDTKLTYTESLQPLWSGYGEIARYYSPRLTSSVIVKSVTPPQQVKHPRGWHSSVGHKRKLASYRIEAYFYKHYAQRCSAACYVPKLIAFTESVGNAESQTLVMEDLINSGFDDVHDTLTIADISIVLHWLAHFHALFLDDPASGLWSIGTYWYLDTRQDEFKQMQDGPLKKAAFSIDKKLNNARFQTIIHGDAKIANFCFGTTINNVNNLPGSKFLKRVAAVDFQYVGRGVGVKDLAYFLGSCLSENDLLQSHDELLSEYFSALKIACDSYQKQVDFSALEKEWRELYAFSCADFQRFLQGWSPEHHKINAYLQTQTGKVLGR